MKKNNSYLDCLLFIIQDNIDIVLTIQRHCVYENYVVKYSSSSIKVNDSLRTICQGIGDTVEKACEDYFNRLIGKTIIFNEGENKSVIEMDFQEQVKKYNQSILEDLSTLTEQEVFNNVCKELDQ